MVDIVATFKLYCGADVRYVSHEVDRRTLTVKYTVPLCAQPDHIFTVTSVARDGLGSSLHRAVRRAAYHARMHAYMVTGKQAADLRTLLKGRLTDEHSRGLPQTSEDGAAAAEHSEP